MRDAGIHIKRSTLEFILQAIGVSDYKLVADRIIVGAKGKQLRNRLIINTTQKTTKKAINLIKHNISDKEIENFNRLLDGERRNLGHRGMTVIRKDSTQYQQLKDVARTALEFALQFEFTNLEAGYKEYIQLGIKMMNKKYAINKFITYKERIFQSYAYKEELAKDDDRAATSMFYTAWRNVMTENADMAPDLTKEPDKYVSMLYGRQAADKAKAVYRLWIQAQFDALVFLNAIPELVQFYGDQAEFRYTKYMAKNKLTKAAEPEESDNAYLKALRK